MQILDDFYALCFSSQIMNYHDTHIGQHIFTLQSQIEVKMGTIGDAL